jgi:hypothetical protein
MSNAMTRDEARAWMAGWKQAAAREVEELRQQSFEDKLRALAFLMSSTDLFDVRTLDAEDDLVRARWAQYRSIVRTL